MRSFIVEIGERHLAPGARVQFVVAPGEERVVGRSADFGAEIIVKHATVARRHVRFANVDGVLTVEDLGSHCGIFVNHSAANRGAVEVRAGDVVTMGQILLVVSRPDDSG